MMRFMQIKTHWTAEEAYQTLIFLDELRESIWQNYGNDIIEYCQDSYSLDTDEVFDCGDDAIPF